ncbi:hypothetical protein B4U79_02626, partial [Dinothrombium tinctorium]
INQVPIKVVEETKFLGIILDNRLKFTKHIKYISNKVSHKIYCLQKLRPFISKESAITVYKILILPHFDYCPITFTFTHETNLNLLQNFRTEFLKILLDKIHISQVK